MSRIFWDTNLFIYLFEDSGVLSNQVEDLRRRMITRGDQLLTSAVTLGEILVKPTRDGDATAIEYYKRTILGTAAVIPFEENAAVFYARIRADRSLRAPDAIQLACAASVGVDLFITNDAHLYSKRIAGIQFITSLDRAPI